MNVKAGQKVTLIKTIVARDAFFKNDSKPGMTTVTLEQGTIATAVIDEIGGNIMIETTTPEGEGVFVALAQGEFAAA